MFSYQRRARAVCVYGCDAADSAARHLSMLARWPLASLGQSAFVQGRLVPLMFAEQLAPMPPFRAPPALQGTHRDSTLCCKLVPNYTVHPRGTFFSDRRESDTKLESKHSVPASLQRAAPARVQQQPRHSAGPAARAAGGAARAPAPRAGGPAASRGPPGGAGAPGAWPARGRRRPRASRGRALGGELRPNGGLLVEDAAHVARPLRLAGLPLADAHDGLVPLGQLGEAWGVGGWGCGVWGVGGWGFGEGSARRGANGSSGPQAGPPHAGNVNTCGPAVSSHPTARLSLAPNNGADAARDHFVARPCPAAPTTARVRAPNGLQPNHARASTHVRRPGGTAAGRSPAAERPRASSPPSPAAAQGQATQARPPTAPRPQRRACSHRSM
jgi:hypothetical protein